MNLKCKIPWLFLIQHNEHLFGGEQSTRVQLRVLVPLWLPRGRKQRANRRSVGSHPQCRGRRVCRAGYLCCPAPLHRTPTLCQLGKIGVNFNSSIVWPQGRNSSMPPLNKVSEIPLILSTAGSVSGRSIGYGGPSWESSGLHPLCRVHKGGCSLPRELPPPITVSLSAIRSERHKISNSIFI